MANDLQLINMNGLIKHIRRELAFDTQLQSQMNFYPCDETGRMIDAPEGYQEESNVVEKKSVAVAHNPEIILPEGSSLKKPDFTSVEEMTQYTEESAKEIAIADKPEIVDSPNESELPELSVVTDLVERKKRGRKPKQ